MSHRFVSAIGAAAVVVTLGGCLPWADKEEPAPLVRPVLSVVLESTRDRQIGFAGTIQPQFQTDRGFQALGRITVFAVDVGDLVRKGQTLARLDPVDLDSQVRSSEADLSKAQLRLANATSAEERLGKLLADKVSTQADYDTARQEKDAAVASVQQAEASLAKAREQLSYATLKSDVDGVVTSKDAQVGQTVSAGQKVLTVARTDAREAVVDLPEDVVQTTKKADVFVITLQADPSISMTAKVREIAPQADADTRTRRVKITLDKITEPFRLGATVTAFPAAATPQPKFEVSTSALLMRDDATVVWVVDPASKTVRTTPVKVVSSERGKATIEAGLSPGDRVVVAGVHSLSEGQVVKIEGES